MSDADGARIEKALAQVEPLIVKAARALGQHPSNVELQRAFAKLVGQRDELERWRGRVLTEPRGNITTDPCAT